MNAVRTPDLTITPVPSPCINICQMHAGTGWCMGCQRTLDEIAAWSGMGDAHKRAVWLALEGRRETWRRLQAAGQAPLRPPPGSPDPEA